MSEIDIDAMSFAQMVRLHREWRALSEAFTAQRDGNSEAPVSAPEALLERYRDRPESPLAPFAQLWASDSALFLGEIDHAVSLLEPLTDRFAERGMAGASARMLAMAAAADARAGAGQFSEAASHYAELSAEFPDQCELGDTLLGEAQAADWAGQHDRALQVYRRLAATDLSEMGTTSEGPAMVLRRRAELRVAALEQGTPWASQDLHHLAEQVVAALRARDAEGLAALSNPVNSALTAAAGCSWLAPTHELLAKVKGRVPTDLSWDGVVHQKDDSLKAYAFLNGWVEGQPEYPVAIQFVREPEGWVFYGMMIPDDLPDGETDTSGADIGRQQLIFGDDHRGRAISESKLNLKAPWARGRHFRAGGILESAVAHLGMPWVHFFSNCGAGVVGFYYGQGSTHTGSDHYAIDFCRFSLPWIHDGTPYPMLAIAEGVVADMPVRGWRRGDPAGSNRVRIRMSPWDERTTAARALVAALLTLFKGPKGAVELKRDLRFRAEYLHLDGPNTIPACVSVGQWVQQGKTIGLMDDTGNSVIPHLHLAIHDMHDGGQSVAIDPLDGQRLRPWLDEGRCCSSTNLRIP